MKQKAISIIVLCVLFLALDLNAQNDVVVRSLLNNPAYYLDNTVRIEGVVDRHVSDAADLGDYFLRDRFGDMIRIRTHNTKPEINILYQITGTFEEGPRIANVRQFYIRELSRTRLQLQSQPAVQSTYTITLMSQPAGVDVIRDGTILGVTPFTTRLNVGTHSFLLSKPFYDDQTITVRIVDGDLIESVVMSRASIFYILIGLGVILVILILTVYSTSVKKNNITTTTGNAGFSQTTIDSNQGQTQVVSNSSRSFGSVENATIKFYQPADKTIKVLKGNFSVLGGLSDIEQLSLYRNPSKASSEYTFGRNPGDDIYHFQLKSPTVSRNQAKLIITNDRYILINSASESSNPTTINGTPLPTNDSAELNNGDIIEMGDVKLRFNR